MDFNLAIEIMFCVRETAKTGRRVTAGEVAKRCGGVVTYHVAKKILYHLWMNGILESHQYTHRHAAGNRGEIIAHHYTVKSDYSVQLFVQGCEAMYAHLGAMYAVVKVSGK